MNKVIIMLSLAAITMDAASGSFAQDAKPSVKEPVFTSAQGFSITPPAGWSVASKETANQLAGAIQQRFPALGNIDLDKFAVLLYTPTSGGAQNLNVIVSPGQMPIDESGAADSMVGALRDQYSSMGVSLNKISASRRLFGHHAALVADEEYDMAGASNRAWQVALPMRGNTLIVTCTAPRSSFDEVAPAFTTAIESMTFPEPSSDFPIPTWVIVVILALVARWIVGRWSAANAPAKPTEPPSSQGPVAASVSAVPPPLEE